MRMRLAQEAALLRVRAGLMEERWCDGQWVAQLELLLLLLLLLMFRLEEEELPILQLV
jgi:hypothetical protein